GVGIVEGEATLNQGFFVVKRHPFEIDEALGIDEDTDIVKGQDVVLGPLFGIELELIAEAGATAAQNTQAQSTLHVVLGEYLTDLGNRFGRYLNLRRTLLG